MRSTAEYKQLYILVSRSGSERDDWSVHKTNYELPKFQFVEFTITKPVTYLKHINCKYVFRPFTRYLCEQAILFGYHKYYKSVMI